MIRLIIFCLLLILVAPMLCAAQQDEALPLLGQIQKAKGVEKIKLLNEVSAVYRKTDRYKSIDFARQAFTLAEESNYLPGIALALKNEGIGWFFIGNNDSAKLCYKQALEAFTSIGDQKGMSACYNNLGLVSQETGKYNEALKYYQFSMDIDQKLGDKIGGALTKANCVDILIYTGNSRKALMLSNEVIAIYRNQSYKEGLMTSLINRAAIYDNLKQFDDAIADQEDAISLAKEQKDSYHEAMALSNMGLVTFHKGKPDEALTILNQALALSDGNEDGYDILNTLWIMSEIYASKKEYEKSNDILQKLLKRFEVIDNKREEAKVLTSLGRNLMELNEIDKAIGYLSKSLELTVSIDARYELLENYRNLAQANAILHNFSAADSLQDLFAEIYSDLDNSDSLADLKNKRIQPNIETATSSSTASDWIIAFSLMLIIIVLSISAYRGKKDEE